MTSARLAAMRALAADQIGAQACAALGAAGVRTILLKGASLAATLYDDGEARGYDDCDLLVAPGQMAEAERVLRGLGFERPHAAVALTDVEHGTHWRRPGERFSLDLHWTVAGAEADPEVVFAALSRRATRFDLAGTEAHALDPSGVALTAALHAAQHGTARLRGIRDLQRAIERLDATAWQHACRLAAEIGATNALAAGLRLVPEGSACADRLGLPARATVSVAAQMDSAPPTTRGWYLFANTRGLLPRLRFLALKLFPHPEFMRARIPLARRGPAGMALAYARRALTLPVIAPRGLVAFLAARRGERSPLTRHDLAAAWWTLRALRAARRRLRTADAAPIAVAPPPALPRSAVRGVNAVLRRSRATCLVKASVRQAWHAAQGSPRDLVIGVTAPAAGFRAHAWLDGDPESASGEYAELSRRPAPAVSTR